MLGSFSKCGYLFKITFDLKFEMRANPQPSQFPSPQPRAKGQLTVLSKLDSEILCIARPKV